MAKIKVCVYDLDTGNNDIVCNLHSGLFWDKFNFCITYTFCSKKALSELSLGRRTFYQLGVTSKKYLADHQLCCRLITTPTPPPNLRQFIEPQSFQLLASLSYTSMVFKYVVPSNPPTAKS